MTWVLIIIAASGGTTSATQSSLATCQQMFRAANLADVKSAYCDSATGDRVWIIKDGVSFTVPQWTTD